MSSFDKDLVTKVVVASNEQWKKLLAIKSNKDVYKKFRYKALANENLLYSLFLDSLAIEAHVVTSQDIASINKMKDEKNANAKRKKKKN